MGNLAFLGIAVAVFAVGLLYVWVRGRNPKVSYRGHIDQFRSEMGALDPRPPTSRQKTPSHRAIGVTGPGKTHYPDHQPPRS